MKLFVVLAVATAMAWSVGTAKAEEPGLDTGLDWPNFYDPEAIRDLNVKIKQQDWDLIRADDTYDIEVPALFWLGAEGEENAVLVSIRRKSATPIGTKVSFKIDINEYEDEDPRARGTWHGLKKLSLENGDDRDVVAEAMAWYLHRLASNSSADAFPSGSIPCNSESCADVPAIYPDGHLPGLANWATLTTHVVCVLDSDPGTCKDQHRFAFDGTVSVEPQGVYVNVEQPDKQFLKNRGIWVSDETWLYKQDDPTLMPEVKEAPELIGCSTDPDGYCISPASEELQCAPFLPQPDKGRKGKLKPCEHGVVDTWVNMPILLATGAVNAFSSNPDELLNHEKNFLFVDYAPNVDGERLYFPWDLDSAFSNGRNQGNVYGEVRKRRGTEELRQTLYQSLLLQDYDEPAAKWCTTYNDSLTAMTNADFVNAAISYLNLMEEKLTPLVEDDMNSKIGDAEAHFSAVRTWLTDRADNVQSQISANCR